MEISEVFAQYLEHIFAGKRWEARELVERTLDRGVGARKLIQYVVWPAMEQIEALYRKGRIDRLMEHIATRINRMIADQLQARFARGPKSGQRLVVTCGDGEMEELGAQMTGDLFEADGWSVWFLGSGVPNDEVLQLLGNVKPDVLCIYGTQASGLANVRGLIEMIREINAWDEMQILLVNGVFKRAPGLAEEVRADLQVVSPKELLKIVRERPVRIPKPDLPQPGRRRKRKTTKAAHASKPAKSAKSGKRSKQTVTASS